MKADVLIEQVISEGFKITRGMKKAYEKLIASNGAKRCPECGTTVPRYPGRYPSSCPHCGVGLENVTSPVKRRSNDDRKINKVIRAIPKDRIPS